MNEVKNLLGKRIKELRLLKGLSQKELAYKMHMNVKTLSGIETGRYFPSNYLSGFSECLNVKVSDLFDYDHLAQSEESMQSYIVESLPEFSSKELDILCKLVMCMN